MPVLNATPVARKRDVGTIAPQHDASMTYQRGQHIFIGGRWVPQSTVAADIRAKAKPHGGSYRLNGHVWVANDEATQAWERQGLNVARKDK